MKKFIYTAFFALVFNVLSHAQGLQNHIPAYAQYVITLNAESYSGKVDMNAIGKMDFFKPISTEDTASASEIKLITTIFSKPGDCGAKVLPQAYVFRIDHDSISGWCYLFGLKDAGVFGKFLEGALKEKGKGQKGPEITRAGSISKLQSGRITAAWTSDFAMLMIIDRSNSYSYYEDYTATAAATAYDAAREDSIQAVEMARLQMITDSIKAVEAAEEAKLAAQKKKAKPTKATPPSKKNKAAAPTVAYDVEVTQAARDSSAEAMSDSIAASITGTNNGTYGNMDWEQKEKERQEKMMNRARERGTRRILDFINMDPSRSVTKVRSYMEAQKEKFDVALWMNYTGDAFPGLNPTSSRHYAGMKSTDGDTTNSLMNLFKDNYSIAYCNFEAGKLNMVSKAYVNPEMEKLMNGIYKSKGNKNFCKYIKGDHLMGYASMSFNVEPTLKATREIMKKTYEATMGKESKYITGAMDILAVFTNDDVAYNLFKGDFALAITDLRPFKTSFLSYSYDDNFNRSETKQEKTEVLPEFVAMASVGKPEEMTKLLQAVEHMGGLRAEAPGVYLVEMPGQAGYKIYIALENNILFCTNNEDLIHQKLKDGYPKDQQMTKDQKKLFTTWPVAYYWNGTKTFDLVSKQPELKSNDKLSKGLNLFKDNLKEAELTGVKKEGNCYVTTASMTFTDSSVNSLFSLCKVVNSFILLDK